MSQRIEGNYGHVALVYESICDMAHKGIEELDKILNEIDSSSTAVLNK